MSDDKWMWRGFAAALFAVAILALTVAVGYGMAIWRGEFPCEHNAHVRPALVPVPLPMPGK